MYWLGMNSIAEVSFLYWQDISSSHHYLCTAYFSLIYFNPPHRSGIWKKRSYQLLAVHWKNRTGVRY